MDTDAKPNVLNEDNNDMTLQSGVAMALSQSQWNLIQQSNISPNLPFYHQLAQTSGDIYVAHGDGKDTTGGKDRKYGDQSGEFQEKIPNKQNTFTLDNDDNSAWELKPLPDLTSLSRTELIQYRKSLKQRKTHLKVQSKCKGNNKLHKAQLRVIDKELERLFHLLKWRPTSYKNLILKSDEELKARQEELNSVRLNPTYSVTDYARVNHEMDKIQSLLDERRQSNLIRNQDSANVQEGGNEKREPDRTNQIKKESDMKDIYHGVEAYLKFLRRSKRIKRN